MQICSHHEPNPAHPNCPTNEFSTKACPKGCSEKTYPVAWGKDTHLASVSGVRVQCYRHRRRCAAPFTPASPLAHLLSHFRRRSA